MFKGLKVAAVAAVGVFAASGANAATITYTDSVALSDVEIAGTLSAPQFNSALGTLTGVSWSITGAIASVIGVENDSGSTITGSAFTNVEFDLTSALLSLDASPDFSIFASTGLVSLGVGASALFPVTATATITGVEAVSSAFIGGSLVDVLYLTMTSFGGNGFGGDITISQATDAGISFSLTYEYSTDPTVSEVPLPAAAPLMLAGMGLFGFVAKRRRKHAA